MRHSVECPKYDADCCWVSVCLQGSALGVYCKSVDATALLDRWGKIEVLKEINVGDCSFDLGS